MALDDDAVGHVAAELLPNVPQRGRPDQAVLMLVGALAVVEALIGDGPVQAPQARRVPIAGDAVPARDRGPVASPLLLREEAGGKVVAEALAHGRGLRRLPEVR